MGELLGIVRAGSNKDFKTLIPTRRCWKVLPPSMQKPNGLARCTLADLFAKASQTLSISIRSRYAISKRDENLYCLEWDQTKFLC